MTRQNKRTSGWSRTEVRLLLLAVALICVIAFVPAMGTADHTDDHTESIDSDNVTITLGDDSPGATTTHDWTIQVSEEFGEVDEIRLRYSDKDSQFDDEIDAGDLVEGNINVVGGGALDVDLVRYWGGDILFRINDSSLAAGDTIEIAWRNEVFTNPPETGSEHISMEMRDFDDDYVGSGGDSVFIPGEIEVTDLEVTNPDSNQLSEYQFEFSVEEYPIDNVWRIRVDFSDAYEDGLDFDDMDMDFDTDDYWFEDADGNELDSSFQGTVYGTEDVLEFHIEPDRLETDLGAGPYTFGFKNITNPDPGTDYEVEMRIHEQITDVGPMAADNATFDVVQSPTMSIEDTDLTHATTYDPGVYEIDVEFANADADDVDGFAVTFIDAEEIDADDLTAADVDVTGAVVDEVNTTDTDAVKLELADPVTYQENEQATIVLDGVTNPSEIGDFDVKVEFFAYGNSYGNDTLADAFTIEPSLVVGDWESPRSVPNGTLSPNSFTVENVGEVDLTGITVHLGADSEADAFEKPASFSAIVETWSDETIDAGDTKDYKYDLMTEDYFDIGENYEKGEDFYHGPAVGYSSWGVFDQQNADSLPFYISESDDSGSITASVENETGHPVDGAQVDLYVHEVAPENLVASEQSADSTVTFDESHPDVDDGLAVGTDEADAIEYVIVVDKDGYEESAQSTALYDGNHEVSEVVTVTEIEPPTFEITRFDILETDVETGEEFYTLANVTNTGEEFGLDVARLKLDGEELENDTVALDPGERDTVSFAHDAPDEEGNYTISIETQDDVASGTLNVTEPEPATFEITRFDILETDVETGEEFYTLANVTNTGEEFGLDVARLKLDGQELENDTLALDPGERDTVSLLHDAPDEGGNYTITIETQDDIASGTLNVTEPEPATFEIDWFDILETDVETGDEFVAMANVSNIGEEFGLDVVRLKLDGEELVNDTVALDPGERDTVTFGQDAPEEPGTYTVSVETQDDHATEEITVGPNFQVLDADMPVDVDQGDNVTVEFTIENSGTHDTQQVNFSVYASEQDEEFPFYGQEVIHVGDELTLDAGETTTRELEYEVPENLAPDLYTQELSTENDAVVSELWIELEANIEVSSYSFDPDPAEEDLSVGDTLTVEAVLTNHGTASGEFESEYIVDEEVVASETVEVDADTTEIVELEHKLRESGTKIISINGVDPVQIVVEPEPEPDIEVSSYSFDPDPAEEDLFVGETLTVEAVLTNHGDASGEFEVEYIVDEEVVASETVEVDADTTETVELDYELQEADTKIISVNGVDPVQIVVEPEPEPDIEVSSYSFDPDPASEDLSVGDTLTVEAVLTNNGTASGESEVEYIVNEEVVANETVEVDADTTEIVELEHELRESGTKIISVNGVDPVQIAVEEPGVFLIDDIDAPPTADPGEEIQVLTAVSNDGTEIGEQNVTVEINDGDSITRKISIGPGEWTSQAFQLEVPDETGTYTITATTNDDTKTTNTTVDEDDDGSPAPPPSPPEDETDETETVVETNDDGSGGSVTDAKAGESVSIPLDVATNEHETRLEKLDVTPAEDTDFDVTVDTYSEPPGEVDAAPENSDALLYLDVDSSLESEDIESATFEFSVPRDILDERDIEPSEVTMFHNVDGEWTERETDVVEENGTVTFQVDTPHFSVFVLAGNQPSIDIMHYSVSASNVAIGEDVTVDIDIQNTGGVAGTKVVDLFADDEHVGSDTVTLDSGERTSVNLTVVFDTSGEFELSVNSDLSTLIAVEEAEDEADADGDDDSVESDDKSEDSDDNEREDEPEGVDDSVESDDESEDSDDNEREDEPEDGDESDEVGPGFGPIVAIIGIAGGGYLVFRRANVTP